jgi:peroxiredoxin (alkyl hydroperoxide reductase subunit C)
LYSGIFSTSIFVCILLRKHLYLFIYYGFRGLFLPELEKPAPNFTLDSTKGKVSLSDFKGKWVILFSYPLDFTPICESDNIVFSREIHEFDQLNVQLLGFSVDSVESHMRWINDIAQRAGVKITYPLIADTERELTRKYGVLHANKDVAYRGLFIIDPQGVLRFAAIYPLEVGRSTKETLRIIRVLQRAEELREMEEIARAKELSKYTE